MRRVRSTAVVWRVTLAATMLVACGRMRFETLTVADVDAARDGAVDASNDAATDAQRDAAIDASNDAAPDALTADAQRDATMDASSDATPNDAAQDASADAMPDAQTPVCTWSAPEEITGLNVTGDLWGPSLSPDARTLYFARRDGADELIMTATRTDRGTVFSAATPLAAVNSSAQEGTPHISADDRTLYFFSTRPGGVGDRDIWYVTRPSASDPFGPATLLPNVNSTSTEYAPRVSPDGLTLWVTTSRAGSSGPMDVWTATRNSRMETFGAASNVSELNTPAFEAAFAFSSDGLWVVFASDRDSSMQLDLWTAARASATEPFGPAETIAIATTSGNEADPILTADDSELFYSSDRDGARKLWRLRRVCE